MAKNCDAETLTKVQVPTIRLIEKGKKYINQQQNKPIKLGKEGLIIHHNHTRGGDSGTPLLVQMEGPNTCSVAGIHVTKKVDAKSGYWENRCVRITSEVVKELAQF